MYFNPLNIIILNIEICGPGTQWREILRRRLQNRTLRRGDVRLSLILINSHVSFIYVNYKSDKSFKSLNKLEFEIINLNYYQNFQKIIIQVNKS